MYNWAYSNLHISVLNIERISQLPGRKILILPTFVIDIRYDCDFKDPMSPKGKCPWMQFNGEAISDSQFCIERLKEEFVVDLDDHLTAQEKAISKAFVAVS